MPTAQNWWCTWAPYWEHLEDRHLSIYTTQKIERHIKSPVLIVGAGQGLIVEYLKNRGHRVEGIDLEPAMIDWAQKRRGICLTQANANSLPFQSAVYQTVIIASGVVDYLREPREIDKILEEAVRVLAGDGTLLVAFHQIPPHISKIYRDIGVVSRDRFFLRRIFDISMRVKKNPLSCVRLIANWTGRHPARVFVSWTKLGLSLPQELKEENDKVAQIFERAAAEGISPDDLYQSVPEEIPLRDGGAIAEMFTARGFRDFSMHQGADCLVVIQPRASAGRGTMSMRRSEAARNPPTQPTRSLVIETRDLTKHYKNAERPAVDKLNLGIEHASVFGILGPNGAGKTTTLMMLSGLLRADSGEMIIAPALREKGTKTVIGYVPQDLALYPKLSGRDNLIFFGRLYKLHGRVLKKRIAELLEMSGLADRADDLVDTYSTGMKRRLNLVVGLIHRPAIVLMDEPTVGIDPQSRNRIYDAIAELKDEGVTILYTTHYMEEASRLCDRIAIIDQGKVLLEGAPGEIVRQHGTSVICFEFRIIEEEAEPRAQVSGLLSELLKLNGVKSATLVDGALNVTTKDHERRSEQIELIDQCAQERKIQLRLQNVVEPNLESLFLDLTGRQLRDNFADAS